MMNKTLAINIVLLPPDDVIDKVIDFNNQLTAMHPSAVKIGKDAYLPHITLLQTIIETANLKKAYAVLNEVAAGISPIPINAKLEAVHDQTHYLIALPNAELQKLHENIMRSMNGIVNHEAKAQDFSDPKIEEHTVQWVRDFESKHAYKNFVPHITVGQGHLKDVISNIDFTASRLAICNLVSHGRCERILYETTLSPLAI
jgi:2'-5' RNA ligase